MRLAWMLNGSTVDVRPINTPHARLRVIIPNNKKYVEWLTQNVGANTIDWTVTAKRNSTGFVGYRFRFRKDADAVMFKMVFIEDKLDD